MIQYGLNGNSNIMTSETVDPEVLEWYQQVILKDEYYDIIEDIDFDDLIEKLKD